MKSNCILFFFCLFALSSFAQATLQMRLHKIPTKRSPSQQNIELVLGSYYADKFHLVKAIPIGNDTFQNFEFSIPANTPTGLYQLFIGDKTDQATNKAEFIWGPKESLVMDAVFYQLKDGGLSIEKSVENEAYAQLNAIKNLYEPQLEELYQKRQSVSIFDPKFKQKVAEVELQAEKTQYEFNVTLVQLNALYPKTFTTEVVMPLTRVPARSAQDSFMKQFDSYISFLNTHYFKHTDFSNSGILYHYAFWDKLFAYFNSYTEKSTDGALYGIDVIMRQLKENQEVNDFVYNTLLKTFIKLNSETLTKHLMEQYGGGCALQLPFEDLKKLQAITAVATGAAVPEISMPDLKGNYQSLKAYCSKNKYTILFVWVSWCTRCKKEMPVLVDLYNRLKSKGLGVYALSLDENKADWQAAIQKYNSQWLDVSELVAVPKSQVLASYSISTTPALFILNEKGELLHKNLFGEELLQTINKLLQSK